jgi:hypothetical protein
MTSSSPFILIILSDSKKEEETPKLVVHTKGLFGVAYLFSI